VTRRRDREPVITIDGPAGAGKGTVATLLARRLGYRLLDTGAMYRAVALSLARAGIALDDEAALRRHLDAINVWIDDGSVYLDGTDVSADIRTPAISQLTSRISALRAVREKVTPLQRREAEPGGVVLEGRDTGTVVCPDAEVKFFLTASLEARARRRHAELRARGASVSLEAVRDEVAARDEQDANRELAPLRRASDAIEVETTDLGIDDVVDVMLKALADRRRDATLSDDRTAVRARRA
jgi:CMP/dCMP kinase